MVNAGELRTGWRSWSWSKRPGRTAGRVSLGRAPEDLGQGGADGQDVSLFPPWASAPGGVEFTIRRRELTLHQAFRWNGRHCFLSSIVPDGPGHLKVTAALVDLADCVGNANKTPGGRGSRRC